MGNHRFTTICLRGFAYVAVTLFLFLGVYVTSAYAFNAEINYQGKLTDTSGDAVADGNYSIEFNLYTAASGGVAIWTETQSTHATSGLFSVMLGDVTALSGVDFTQTLYLGVTVGADSEMTPRKILGAVPAAFEAGRLDGIDSTQFLRSDAADTIATSSALTLLTVNQSGTGDILNLQDGGTTIFTVLDGGSVGIGTTTPSQRLTIAGNMRLSGAFYDRLNSAGTNGMVLQTTGSGTQWVATSTLGFGRGTVGTSTPLVNTYITYATAANTIGAEAAFTYNSATNRLTVENASTTVLSADTICLNADSCRTTWPTGGGGAIGTSTPLANTQMVYATGVDTVGSEAAFTYNAATNRLTVDNIVATNATTTNATTTRLAVSGSLTMTGSAANILLGSNWLSGDGGDEGVFVDGDGDVGVGTSTPSHKLSVYGDILAQEGSFVLGKDSFAGRARFNFRDEGGGSVQLDTNLDADDSIDDAGEASARLQLTTGYNGQNDNPALLLQFNTDLGDWGTNYNAFSITKNSAYIAEELGIGESSPGSKLSVSGGGTFGSGYDTTAAPTNGLLVEGSVGIGTTSPLTKLSVQGNSRITGNLQVAGLTATSTITFSNLTSGLLYANSSGVLSASSSIAASFIEDAYVRNTGDSISGNLTFSGSAANILLGSNWLSGDGGDEGVFVDGDGDVGVGDATPAALFTVGNGDLFQVNSSGAIAAVVGITSSDDIILGAGDQVDFADEVGDKIYLFNTTYGLGVSSSEFAIWSNGSWSFRSVSRTGTELANLSSQGTLQIDGRLVVSTTTATSTFAGGLTIETSGFVYDSFSNRVGIGTSTPLAKLTIQGTSGSTANLLSVASSTGAVLAGFNYGSGGSPAYDYGRLLIGNMEFPSTFSEIYRREDTINTGSISTWIVPGFDSERLFFGAPGRTFYSVNFSNVSNIESMPAFSTADSMTWGGDSSFAIRRNSHNLQYIASAPGAGNHIWYSTSTAFSGFGSAPERMRLTGDGNLGIGTSSPLTKLSVQGNATVTGNLGVAGLTATSTVTFSTLTDAIVLTNGSGVLAEYTGTTCPGEFVRSISALGVATCAAGGGSSISTSTALADTQMVYATGAATIGSEAAFTYNAGTNTLSVDNLTLTNDLSVANGGTGASTLTGLLQGNGAGAITGVTGTAGQFPYYNGTNTLLATSTIFLATTGRVGIGTTTPGTKLNILDSTGAQLRLSNTGALYSNMQVAASTGDMTISLSSGQDIFMTQPGGSTGANLWVCEGDTCPSLTIADGGNVIAEGAYYFENGYYLRPVSSTAVGFYDDNDAVILIIDDGT